MKKRILIYSMFCALSLSVLPFTTACVQDKPTDVNPVEKGELIVTTEGKLMVGETINIVIKDSKGEIVSDPTLEVTEGASLVEVTGTSIKLKAAGAVKITIKKKDYKDSSITFTISEVPLKEMKVELKGYLYHGETIVVDVTDSDNKPVEGVQIDLTKGADFAMVNGNKISLLDSGEVEGVIKKEGFKDYTLKFTSQKVERIKDVKDNIDQFVGKMVTVRGVVTASYGNTFYLMDGKNGFYVYNMNTMDSTSNPGDGFELGKVVMNTPVLVTALVDNGNFGMQLKGYDGGYIKEACVLKSNMEATKPITYEVKNEGDLMSLNASKKLSGSRVRVTAKFLGGDFSAAEQTNAKNAIFTFQYGETTFDAKFNKYGAVETVKGYWNKENIEIGDYVTIESNFTHYKDHISVDLCNEGTYVHNESKDPTNIICESSAPEVKIGESITLNAKLPEGLTGDVTYEILSGTSNVTLVGNKLTGIKEGLVRIVAKVGQKQSMPIEIVVKAKSFSTVSSVRDLAEGTQVETIGNVVTFLKNGLAIQDETGFLYCIAEGSGEYYPQGINIGDTVKISGVRYNYNKTRKLPCVNQCTFEVFTKKEIVTNYQKVTQADFKNFTPEELKYGKAVEFDAVVDKINKSSSTGMRTGTGSLTIDPTDEAGTDYYFYYWGNDKELNNLEKAHITAIVYHSYQTAIGKPGFSLLITSAKKVVVAPTTIDLQIDSPTIDTRLTYGSASTYATITIGPDGASKELVELVAIEGADLVTIKTDFFRDFKIMSTGKPGKVKLQAQTKDGKVKSQVVELTVNLYAEQ